MRAGRRLVEDFLLPSLNDRRYGDLLKWEDKEKLHFSIRWSHKNAAKWSLEDTQVFQDWDKMKGHHRPEIKGYYMQAKQRFRAALYKLNTVKKLKSEDKHIKKYQLVEKYQLLLENRKKRKESPVNEFGSSIKSEPITVDENQTCIPTSVICWNDGHTDHSPEHSYQWTPTVVPDSSALNYSIAKCNNSEEEILDFSRHSSPLLQENRVTSVQEQNLECSIRIKPEISQSSSSSTSLRSGFGRNLPDYSNDLDRSREFFARLELMQRSDIRTPKSAESDFVPNKRMCVSPTESVLKSDEESRNRCSYEMERVDSATKLKTYGRMISEPVELFDQCESKTLSNQTTCASNATTLGQNLVSHKVSNLGECVLKSEEKHELPQRKPFVDVPKKSSGNPHVPIPPLPGYSKSSVIPRKPETQHNVFPIRDSSTVAKPKPSAENDKMAWQKGNSIPCVVDGPLNLSTKPDGHYKSESPGCTDR